MAKQRVLVGMSGGVDSSVAAALLKDKGYDVIGVTLKLYDYADLDFDPPDGACCSVDLINDARSVCAGLNIPHYVVDMSAVFEKKIIDDFVESYSKGRTPNPCINCNRFMKWGEMLTMADKLECRFVSTGHYARIERSGNAVSLLKSVDIDKDQSYALWGIRLDALARTLLPVGELTKRQVRQIARERGFRNSNREESQEICFVPSGHYSELVRKRKGPDDSSLHPGPILDINGRQIGEHKGFARYTIGQRGGLGISSSVPLYVKRINPEDNSIVVAARNQIADREFTVKGLNLLVEKDKFPESVNVKIRYRHPGSAAKVRIDGDSAIVTFQSPERAITPGQSAVFYDKNRVLGGGIIDQVFG